MKRKNLLVTILIIAMVAMFAMPMSVYAVPTPPTQTGSGMIPGFVNGNDNEEAKFGFKIDSTPSNGDYPVEIDGILIGTLTITNATNYTFDWSFTNAAGYTSMVTSINVKAAPGYYQFVYTGNLMSDTGLFSPMNLGGEWAAISHVTFLFKTQIVPPPTSGKITIEKKIVGDTPLSDAGFDFELYNVASPEAITTFTITGEGEKSFNEQPFGEYVVREISLPAGYTIEETSQSETTISANQQTGKITITNRYTDPNPTTEITITKKTVTEGTTEIPTGTFNFIVYNAANDSEITEASITLNAGTTTGSITVSPLAVGAYYVKETGTPVNFELVDNEYEENEIPVSFNGTSGAVTITNSYSYTAPTSGTITVNKDVVGPDGKDITDTTPFNFSFKNVDSDGSPTGGQVREGTPVVITLPFGSYSFMEATLSGEKPAYTEINNEVDKTYIVTISETTPTGIVTFTNKLNEYDDVDEETGGNNNEPKDKDIIDTETPLAEKIPVIEEAQNDDPVVILEEPVALAGDPTVPQTGDSNNILLLLGLMFASGAGIAALGRRKENAGK